MNNLSIFGSGISTKVHFIVPVACVAASSKEFNFPIIYTPVELLWCISGVCFFTTTMGLAHGDILLQMIPVSNKFLIFCFKNSWCLRAKGHGQAANWAGSSLVAMCISMRSVWPISLSLFEIMVSYFCNSLYKVVFVSYEIFALFNSTCL